MLERRPVRVIEPPRIHHCLAGRGSALQPSIVGRQGRAEGQTHVVRGAARRERVLQDSLFA